MFSFEVLIVLNRLINKTISRFCYSINVIVNKPKIKAERLVVLNVLLLYAAWPKGFSGSMLHKT